MSSINQHKKVEKEQLVEFSRIFAGLAIIVCGISYYRHGELSVLAKAFALVGLTIGISGLLHPVALTPLFNRWIWLGEKLAMIVSRIVVLLTFFLVITPVGLLLKLLGRDILGLKVERNSEDSYFTKPDVAIAKRYETPF